MRSVSTVFALALLALSACGGSGASTTGLDKQGVAGPPASIVIYAGSGQSATAGKVVNDPLCTNVLDAAGHRLYGIRVTYTVATGGGTLANPTEPATDYAGIATSGLWTLGPLAGAQTVTASSPGVGSVTFTAYAN